MAGRGIQPRGCCSRGFFQMCFRGAKWLPVVLIVAIVTWSYYAYIVHLCIFTVIADSGAVTGVILAALYHVFLIPFLLSYWQTVWTRPGRVPAAFNLSSADMDAIESASEPRQALENLISMKDLAVSTRSMQGEIRYCSECSHIKPDRCHHCSVCNDCVLKMDHHCPWVNNCVGFYNQKFFFLFLGYAFLYCMYVMLSTLKYFIAYWSHEAAMNFSSGKFHVLFLFFVSGMFAISLLSLFSYHIYLISQNRTTLEAFRAPIFRHGGSNRRGFYLGKANNLREVLGDQMILWFVPIFTSLGDGLTFPRQCQMNEEDGLSDGYDSDTAANTRHNNRRYANGAASMRLEEETVTEDDAEEELLIPRTQVWSERESAIAETSPDSLLEAGDASVTYEGFNKTAANAAAKS